MTAPDGASEPSWVRCEWLSLVRELIAAREYHKAGEAAAVAVLEFPFDGDLWELGGLASWMDGDDRAAVVCLEAATTYKPLHPFARVALADGYTRFGKTGLAHGIWEFLAGLHGGGRLIGWFTEHPEQVPDSHTACRVFRTVADHDPANHRAWFGLGMALAKIGGDGERVAESIAVAVRLAPAVAPYRLSLAEAWLKAGHAGRAADALRSFDAGLVTCPHVLVWATTLFRKVGDGDRAGECTRQCDGLTKDDS